MIYGIQTKITKEINLRNLKNMLSKNNARKVNIKFKEYDNLKNLIHNFLKKNYKFVSFVFGGFENIHDESLKYNIPLLNHDENCSICKKKNKKKQKYGFLSKLFGKSKKDKNISKQNTNIIENQKYNKDNTYKTSNNNNNITKSGSSSNDLKESFNGKKFIKIKI